ncbi:MAG: NUDIX domain-containing protein [Chthoniobacteraceae bacterium]
MNKTSAGILLFRQTAGGIEVLIVHPGGPFFAKKDAGAWSIPKGETEPGEDLEATARREFREETGIEAVGPLIPLGEVRMKSGKLVHAWALDRSGEEIDPAQLHSNTFQVEWPPKSGQFREFPEIDRAAFGSLATAREKLNPALIPFLDRLEQAIG